MMSVVKLDRVSTSPWGPELVHDISLQLEAGEILGISPMENFLNPESYS